MSAFEMRREVLRREDIDPGSKCLAILIIDLQGLEAGACTMSNESLSAALGCTPRTVQRYLRDLRFVGLLEVAGDKARRLRIKVRVYSKTGPNLLGGGGALLSEQTGPQQTSLDTEGDTSDVSSNAEGDTSGVGGRQMCRGGATDVSPREESLEESLEEKTPPTPSYAEVEMAERFVLGRIREEWGRTWRATFPKDTHPYDHEPRPLGPELGYVREVARWLLRVAEHDTARAGNGAAKLVQRMFADEHLTKKGRPWRWKSVAVDPGHFFKGKTSNPRRSVRDDSEMRREEEKWRRAEREAADPLSMDEILRAMGEVQA